MAKRNAVETTPEEVAKQNAARYAELNAKKKEIETELESLKEQLCEYAEQNPGFEFGPILIEKRVGKPKFDFGNLSKGAQTNVLARLKLDLPDFVIDKSEIDLERLAAALPNNSAARNALQVHGIKIVDSESYSIKIVK